MLERIQDLLGRHRRTLLLVGIGLVLIWVVFLDSHSLLKRATWYYEAEALKQENALLRAEIERLELELATDLTDEQIEAIAREQYGMQRPGETVHPVVETE